ncbi:hypothetical protein WG907_05300 [Sphingobium sp. AN558]|uniref:hypothetical protein n=1 Tax=Sphingobium sp. AN558 TaxID=3133442 RepID=UPI0030C3022B
MNDRLQYRADFEAMGVDAVRSALTEGRLADFKARMARGWLAEKDELAAKDRATREDSLTERSVSAAEKQAASAAQANRIARWALAFSGLALAVSIASVLMQP